MSGRGWSRGLLTAVAMLRMPRGRILCAAPGLCQQLNKQNSTARADWLTCGGSKLMWAHSCTWHP